jgi:hypothetical protein
MKQAALALALRGLAVFPCWPNKKTPVCRHGLKEATTDAAIIEAWWNAYPIANVAVATGRVSGAFVVDVDVKGGRDGEADLRALEAAHGKLPPTIEAVTPTKGRHVWFRMPEHPVPNSVGMLAPGLDIRGDGGYVLVPPSQINGARYEWSVDSAGEFAYAPDWLFAKADIAHLDMRRPDEHWQRICRGVGAGARNASCASIAGMLLRRGVDPETTLELRLGWNLRCNPPQDEQDIVRTVESVLQKEIRRRGAR